MKYLRIALAQMNSTVGDLKGNSDKIIRYIKRAKKHKTDIVAFPELAVTGYPPEDLLLKPHFIEDNLSEIKKISAATSGITALVGFVDVAEGNIYNAAAVISEGKVIDVYHKIRLPNYGVFDEFRYFKSGNRIPVYLIKGAKAGINICEDIWHKDGPARLQSFAGAELIININASPYEQGKSKVREQILKERSSENCMMIAYINAVGGQDELVFDGASMVYDHQGNLMSRGKQFAEDMIIADLELGRAKAYRKKLSTIEDRSEVTQYKLEKVRVLNSSADIGRTIIKNRVQEAMAREEEVYNALVLGTSDYIRKNGFKRVVIGLSGGVDSSLVAAVAVDAVGRENVTGLFMPSQYTSTESKEDAEKLATNLGIRITEIQIKDIFREYLKELKQRFKGTESNITEENIQARIRGNLLMAFSNKFGWLVLTTGNKSEMSVGYATLYGDMAGGFAVIKDVPKTLVYDVCRWINSSKGKEIIPENVLCKAPTAELKPDQKDTDSLPPYEELDPILEAYVEGEKSFQEILNLGYDPGIVQKVISMVDKSEYKRRQSPPGIKITARAFGRDWRFPITNRYRSY